MNRRCCFTELTSFPTIDLVRTGQRIRELRENAGYSVKDLQDALMLGSPQAIYKWQEGKNLPSADNLIVMRFLFGVSTDDIIVLREAS